MKVVTDTFAAWKVVNDKIASLEKSSEISLKQYGSGAADFPSESLHELRELQRESDRLLQLAQHALLRIKTPRVTARSGTDSTWL